MGAVQDLVTDQMGIWATAIKRRSTAGRGSSNKIELYGIQKLRGLVLELAVRGLLVPLMTHALQTPAMDQAQSRMNLHAKGCISTPRRSQTGYQDGN